MHEDGAFCCLPFKEINVYCYLFEFYYHSCIILQTVVIMLYTVLHGVQVIYNNDFGQSVKIRNCSGSHYIHWGNCKHSSKGKIWFNLQNVIDNPEKTFKTEDFPEIGNGFTVEDCVATIKHLFKLSLILRYRRFESGALQIDQPKLCFHLDPDTQAPLSSFVFENKESHR